MLILGPLMALVGWIPWVGERLTGAVAFVALLLSVVVVGVLTVAFKFYWVIAAVAAAAIILLIVRGVTTPRQRPVSGPAV
jgi:hypothetical protein